MKPKGPSPQHPENFFNTDSFPNLPLITPAEINQIINAIPVTKAAGCDHLSSKLLWAVTCLQPHSTPFYKVLVERLFPKAWKRAVVTPSHLSTRKTCGRTSQDYTVFYLVDHPYVLFAVTIALLVQGHVGCLSTYLII